MRELIVLYLLACFLHQFLAKPRLLQNTQNVFIHDLGLLCVQIIYTTNLIVKVLNPLLVQSLLRFLHIRYSLLQNLLALHDFLSHIIEHFADIISLLLSVFLHISQVALDEVYLVLYLWLQSLHLV